MNETERNRQETDVLGLWIVEDLMRALDMDINKVEQYVIRPCIKVGESEEKDREWFERIIAMMKAEGIEKSGHLKMCHDAVERLTTRHKALLKDPKNKAYRDLYYDALPAIVDFRSRQQMPEAHKDNQRSEYSSKHTESSSEYTESYSEHTESSSEHTESNSGHTVAATHHPEIESWLELLYGVKLLQLQGKPVSGPTLQAARKVQTLLDMLTGKYNSPSSSNSSNSSNNSGSSDSSNNSGSSISSDNSNSSDSFDNSNN